MLARPPVANEQIAQDPRPQQERHQDAAAREEDDAQDERGGDEGMVRPEDKGADQVADPVVFFTLCRTTRPFLLSRLAGAEMFYQKFVFFIPTLTILEINVDSASSVAESRSAKFYRPGLRSLVAPNSRDSCARCRSRTTNISRSSRI